MVSISTFMKHTFDLQDGYIYIRFFVRVFLYNHTTIHPSYEIDIYTLYIHLDCFVRETPRVSFFTIIHLSYKLDIHILF